MSEQQQHTAYTWLEALYRCRELGAALSRFGTAETLSTVKQGLPSLTCCSSAAFQNDVSHGAAEVAKLVLQELDAAEHCFTCQPTDEGLQTLQLLQQAVFGAGSLQRSFAECVFLASLAQAVHALQLVTAALLDALSPHNCLSLYNIAAACGCAPLRRKALALALRAFPTATQQDCNGLMAMEEGRLLALLCSDSLHVSSELEVFHALATWTERDAAARQPRLAANLARCVRLATLDLADLYTLGDHPLVVSDRSSSQLVAQAVIHLMMGVPLHCPLGLPTNTRRRRSLQAGTPGSGAPAATAAAGQAARQHCAVAEHAHGSVFEAAACAFARRWALQQGEAPAAAAAAGCPASPSPAMSLSGPLHKAPSSAARIAPSSPPAHEAATPTAAAPAAAPAVQPTTRVRQVGVGPRASSRRTLFGMGGSGSGSSGEGGSGPASSPTRDADVDKSPPAVAGLGAGAATIAVAAAAPSLAISSSGGSRLVGGVSLEMSMSPNHASVRALVQQAAAAAQPPQLGNWESRKRLRFD